MSILRTFLHAIREKGVRAKSDQAAIDLAHSTCDLLHRGASVNDALRHVKNAAAASGEPSSAVRRSSGTSIASPPDSPRRSALKGSRYFPPIGATVER
jgi:hypothetical protein